jgi:endonuclease/exonuclease/phosphatase family metal-dependent hydrolase
MGKLDIVTFNMLAPCYKRLSVRDETGRKRREANSNWHHRAENTVKLFRTELLANYQIIALQEFWQDEEYQSKFGPLFQSLGYSVHKLYRHPTRKSDAVALLVKTAELVVRGSKNVHLCSIGDRVALILWLFHKPTGRNLFVANTHLSFPHSDDDRRKQMQQMKDLTNAMDSFAAQQSMPWATKVILGDFNVEATSNVCEHLRRDGYFSCLEVDPPQKNGHFRSGNGKSSKSSSSRSSRSDRIQEGSDEKKTGENSAPFQSNNGAGAAAAAAAGAVQRKLNSMRSSVAGRFVTHRTHRHEDLGVDHIFVKPEIWLHESDSPPTPSRAAVGGGGEGYAVGMGTVAERIAGGAASEPSSLPASVFVNNSLVLPTSSDITTWNERFTISDHRPVGARLIFARKSTQ